MTVPAVLLVLSVCLGGLRLGTERLRVVDAAAQTARLMAIGEPDSGPAAAIGAVRTGTRRAGETVCVTLRSEVPLLGLPVPVTATGCSLAGVDPAP